MISEDYERRLLLLEQQMQMTAELIIKLTDRINETDRILVEEVFTPLTDAINNAKVEEHFENFKGRFGDKLSPYSSMLSMVENEDKDAVREAFDAYNSYSDEERANYPEDKYVEELVLALDDYFAKIRKSLGVSEDTPIAIKSDNAGDMKVQVGDEAKKPIDEAIKSDSDEEGNSEADDFYKDLLKNREKYMR